MNAKHWLFSNTSTERYSFEPKGANVEVAMFEYFADIRQCRDLNVKTARELYAQLKSQGYTVEQSKKQEKASIVNKYGDKAIEASDLGWTRTPSQFSYEGDFYNLIRTAKDDEGEVLFWRYQGVASRNLLTVYND